MTDESSCVSMTFGQVARDMYGPLSQRLDLVRVAPDAPAREVLPRGESLWRVSLGQGSERWMGARSTPRSWARSLGGQVCFGLYRNRSGRNSRSSPGGLVAVQRC